MIEYTIIYGIEDDPDEYSMTITAKSTTEAKRLFNQWKDKNAYFIAVKKHATESTVGKILGKLR